MKTEQFVMAYEVEQDRLRAFLPVGFKSLRPVLRINSEITEETDGEHVYVEFNTPVEAYGKKGWLNISRWTDKHTEFSVTRSGRAVSIISAFLNIKYSGVGVYGDCPAEQDNDGCFFIDEVLNFREKELIEERKEYCDCSFAWHFGEDDAHGTFTGESIPAYYTEPVVKYDRTEMNACVASAIPCKQVLGSYIVTFDRPAFIKPAPFIPYSDDAEEITLKGNPGLPTGDAGYKMLERMNISHDEVTSWGLKFLNISEEAPEILDIGCGGGATLSRILRHYPKGHVTGIDYSEVSVAKSIEFNMDAIERRQIDVMHGSVEMLPFEPDTFDGITTVESFYFWPNHVDNLREVRRVLKEGGSFVLIADIYNNGNLSEKALKNLETFNLFNPTAEEFVELFDAAGFCDIEVNLKEGTSWICVCATKR